MVVSRNSYHFSMISVRLRKSKAFVYTVYSFPPGCLVVSSISSCRYLTAYIVDLAFLNLNCLFSIAFSVIL